LALSARLEIRQGQGLVITPQLQQAIKLLQLSNLELDAFVDAELERNPLLQRDERDAEPDAERRPRSRPTSPPTASPTLTPAPTWTRLTTRPRPVNG